MLKGLSLQGQKLFGFIVKGVESGRSGASILKGLREAGLGYRVQDFYKDLNIIKDTAERWSRLKYVARNAVPSEDLYRPTSAPLESNYTTRCRFTYVNPDTGERFEEIFTIGHNVRMSRSEIFDYWDRYKENFEMTEPEKYGGLLVDILPLQGYRRV